MTLKTFQADLHIHTCLSPCGDLEMSPQAIVRKAQESKLDIIAITDHNSVGNVTAVLEAARNTPLTVIPGMEIASREEVHIVALFPSIEAASGVEKTIQSTLADSSDEHYFQDQVLATRDDEVDGFCTKLLISATAYTIRQLVDMIHDADGLAIAAHIDRQAFGIIGQLGFIPPRVTFDALEISWRVPGNDGAARFAEYAHIPFVTASDAHYLDDIGRVRTYFRMETPVFEELVAALKQSGSRRVEIVRS
ncbi:PHP domain-containing protein [bacterium]|nr:PHP domain-containing protein [candidate division CSSED10-310 bacterium]